ncbi:MAG: hypothetical protein JWO77_3064 [Ilumatobacteraceae bacterium]|nr:hypothetical protein [Ilumatobacteraceae bacterium]
MGELGRIYIIGLVVQFSIEGRPVLLPLFAAASVVMLRRLSSYRALRSSPWFAVTSVCAVITAVACVAAWIPALDLGACLWVAGIAMALGPGAYAGALHDWAVAQGWAPPAAKARTAQVLLLAVPAILAAGLAVVLVAVQPGPVGPDPSYSPASVFGRPLEGWVPGVVLMANAVILVVGLLKLRGASQLIRHSLRAQPDAELVEA